jgi:hypothetical protein
VPEASHHKWAFMVREARYFVAAFAPIRFFWRPSTPVNLSVMVAGSLSRASESIDMCDRYVRLFTRAENLQEAICDSAANVGHDRPIGTDELAKKP